MRKRIINGNLILVKRLPVAKKTKSGLVLPESYIDPKTDVSKPVNTTDKFQKRGHIIGIGISCSKEFKEHFKEGDEVHFGPNSFEPVPLDKENITESTEYVLINEYSIHYKEEDIPSETA